MVLPLSSAAEPMDTVMDLSPALDPVTPDAFRFFCFCFLFLFSTFSLPLSPLCSLRMSKYNGQKL